MTRRLMWILWPGFLMAGVAELVFFSLVDPQELHLFGQALAWSRTTIYSCGFFLFWFLMSGTSALTCLLQRSPFEMNYCPLTAAARPPGCPKQDGGECS
ncbi:MAG: hypothetical protein ABI831_23500 [Betaproteobacteria bacterium]